jgi:hypothetical protein
MVLLYKQRIDRLLKSQFKIGLPELPDGIVQDMCRAGFKLDPGIFLVVMGLFQSFGCFNPCLFEILLCEL